MTHSPEGQDPMATPAMSAGPDLAGRLPAGGPTPDPGAVPMTAPAGPAAAFFQGGVYAQFYILFYVNFAFLIGSILPWHGGADAKLGILTYPGAILFFLAFGSVLSCISGIYTRRVIIAPSLITWLIADALMVVKILDFFKSDSTALSQTFSAEFKEGLTGLSNFFGLGFTFVFLAAVFFLVFFFVSAFLGARTQSKKKEAQKQARAAGRKGTGPRGKGDKPAGDAKDAKAK